MIERIFEYSGKIEITFKAASSTSVTTFGSILILNIPPYRAIPILILAITFVNAVRPSFRSREVAVTTYNGGAMRLIFTTKQIHQEFFENVGRSLLSLAFLL